MYGILYNHIVLYSMSHHCNLNMFKNERGWSLSLSEWQNWKWQNFSFSFLSDPANQYHWLGVHIFDLIVQVHWESLSVSVIQPLGPAVLFPHPESFLGLPAVIVWDGVPVFLSKCCLSLTESCPGGSAVPWHWSWLVILWRHLSEEEL